ncbi:MAG: hypothetical protein WDM87_16650 [Terracidiphilus sp.]
MKSHTIALAALLVFAVPIVAQDKADGHQDQSKPGDRSTPGSGGHQAPPASGGHQAQPGSGSHSSPARFWRSSGSASVQADIQINQVLAGIKRPLRPVAIKPRLHQVGIQTNQALADIRHSVARHAASSR